MIFDWCSQCINGSSSSLKNLISILTWRILTLLAIRGLSPVPHPPGDRSTFPSKFTWQGGPPRELTTCAVAAVSRRIILTWSILTRWAEQPPPLATNLNLSLKPRSQKYLSQLHPRSSTSENKILVLDATTSPLQIWTRTCRGPLHRKTKYLELKLEHAVPWLRKYSS